MKLFCRASVDWLDHMDRDVDIFSRFHTRERFKVHEARTEHDLWSGIVRDSEREKRERDERIAG